VEVQVLLLGSALASAAMADPQRAAVTWNDQAVTFAELDRQANATAHALAGLGISRSDVIVTWAATSLRHIEVFAALAKIGAIFVPLNPAFTPTEAAGALEYLQPRLMITDAGHHEAAMTLAAAPVALIGAGAPVARGADLDLLARAASTGPPASAVCEDDVHAVFLTSGSTGRPKGVALSHRVSWLRGSPGIGTRLRRVGSSGPGGSVWMFPLFHWAGWFAITSGWLNREPVHLSPPDPDMLLSRVQKYSAVEIYCIPAIWERILSLAPPAYDARSLRSVASGTSAVSAELLGRLADRFPGAELSVQYGSTEAGGVCVASGPELEARPGSVGRIQPGYHARLSPEGALKVSGPMVMNGYHRLPEETSRVMHDGWYDTGDLVEIDDGIITVVGRGTEIIRTGGESVAPVEVESVLASYPGVREVAAIGIPDPDWGEAICAVVVMKDRLPVPSLADLRRHAAARLASFKHPRRVVGAESLPRTAATGQVQRRRLVQQVISGSPGPWDAT
jgi:acyl-CoA synthetase (AMP-forming)/AMP-acid ligase II